MGDHLLLFGLASRLAWRKSISFHKIASLWPCILELVCFPPLYSTKMGIRIPHLVIVHCIHSFGSLPWAVAEILMRKSTLWVLLICWSMGAKSFLLYKSVVDSSRTASSIRVRSCPRSGSSMYIYYPTTSKVRSLRSANGEFSWRQILLDLSGWGRPALYKKINIVAVWTSCYRTSHVIYTPRPIEWRNHTNGKKTHSSGDRWPIPSVT